MAAALNFVAATVHRYRLSLGHGALTVCLGLALFLSSDTWTYSPILWALVCAQACLLGFWTALAERAWQVRLVYGGLHLLGLVFCVLAAGQMNLDLRRSQYDLIGVLRDVPTMFVWAFLAGVLLRRSGWQLVTSADEAHSVILSCARKLQIPLGDFIKWFTLLCIVLGLSVSLLPPPSMLLDEWLWRSRTWHYAEFVLAVGVPAGCLASLIFLGLLLSRAADLQKFIRMAGIWCAAALLWIAAVIAGLNVLYNAYYFLQSPMRPRIQVPRWFVSLDTISYGLPGYSYWSLLALVGALVFVAFTAAVAGWRVRRLA